MEKTPAKAYSSKMPGKANDGQRILLVDDDEDIVDIFTEELRNRGLDVYGFTNPMAALDHFKANARKYAMVISDIKMPQMNGFEFVKAVRAVAPEVQVLFITAFEVNMAEFAQVLPSSKVDGFIKKPITPGRLVEVIQQQLRTAQRRRDNNALRRRPSQEAS